MPDELSQGEKAALLSATAEANCGDWPSFQQGWLAHRTYAREQEGDLRQEWEKAHDALGELVGRLWRLPEEQRDRVLKGHAAGIAELDRIRNVEKGAIEMQGETVQLRKRIAELEALTTPAKSHDYPLVGFYLSYRDGAYRVSAPNLLKDGERLHVVATSRLVEAQAEIKQLRKRKEALEDTLERIVDVLGDGDHCSQNGCEGCEDERVTARNLARRALVGLPLDEPIIAEPAESQPADQDRWVTADGWQRLADPPISQEPPSQPADLEPSAAPAETEALYCARDVRTLLSVSGANSTDLVMLSERVKMKSGGRREITPISQQQEITGEMIWRGVREADRLVHVRLAPDEWNPKLESPLRFTIRKILEAALSPSEDTAG